MPLNQQLDGVDDPAFPGVFFRPKSDFQKDICIWCPNTAVDEAVTRTAQIRCCTRPECRKQSAEMALFTDTFIP
jgi:hypothetical protein